MSLAPASIVASTPQCRDGAPNAPSRAAHAAHGAIGEDGISPDERGRRRAPTRRRSGTQRERHAAPSGRRVMEKGVCQHDSALSGFGGAVLPVACGIGRVSAGPDSRSGMTSSPTAALRPDGRVGPGHDRVIAVRHAAYVHSPALFAGVGIAECDVRGPTAGAWRALGARGTTDIVTCDPGVDGNRRALRERGVAGARGAHAGGAAMSTAPAVQRIRRGVAACGVAGGAVPTGIGRSGARVEAIVDAGAADAHEPVGAGLGRIARAHRAVGAARAGSASPDEYARERTEKHVPHGRPRCTDGRSPQAAARSSDA